VRVSLTVGSGPLGPSRGGTFNFETPEQGAILWDPVPQRIRAVFAKEVVLDSTRAKLLHETGHLPVYYFPQDDVRMELLEASEKRTHCPYKGDAHYWSLSVGDRRAPDAMWAYPEPIESAQFLRGHVAFYWEALDEWFAEDEQLFGHPRDPYSRIDVYKSSRHVRVSLDGEVLADTRRAKVLFETALPPRYYLPPDDVRTELLVPSSKKTRCAYKGSASYWHVRVGDRLVEDLVWTYPEPQHDAEPVRDLLCFFNERVDLEVDGERVERPQTQWS
jgi:uncharacterized protein (DUF427 family)